MSHDNMSHEHDHHEKQDTFFEETTVGIGFVYTIIALAIIGALYAFG